MLAKITDSAIGKVSIAVIAVLAIGAAVYTGTHMSTGEQSRNVPPAQVASEAQQQIDAINKMTNLSPQQKQALIAHEQDELKRAQGGGAAAPSQSGPGQAPAGG